MSFEIVRNDIVNMQVDAVVNTANPNPVIGSGLDSGIHKKSGYELLVARQKIGCIDFGDAVITAGFNLDAKQVIHTVGPVWEDGNHGEEQILSSCYSERAMVFSEENFRNKKEMERQMLFFGVISFYNEGLETFMKS